MATRVPWRVFTRQVGDRPESADEAATGVVSCYLPSTFSRTRAGFSSLYSPFLMG